MGILGVSCISALGTMDVIRVEQGGIRPCTSYSSASMRRRERSSRGDRKTRRFRACRRWRQKIAPGRSPRAQRKIRAHATKRTSPPYLCVSAPPRSFVRRREEIHHRGTEALRYRVEGASPREHGKNCCAEGARKHRRQRAPARLPPSLSQCLCASVVNLQGGDARSQRKNSIYRRDAEAPRCRDFLCVFAPLR